MILIRAIYPQAVHSEKVLTGPASITANNTDVSDSLGTLIVVVECES